MGITNFNLRRSQMLVFNFVSLHQPNNRLENIYIPLQPPSPLNSVAKKKTVTR